jgi:hypothetical protein
MPNRIPLVKDLLKAAIALVTAALFFDIVSTVYAWWQVSEYLKSLGYNVPVWAVPFWQSQMGSKDAFAYGIRIVVYVIVISILAVSLLVANKKMTGKGL